MKEEKIFSPPNLFAAKRVLAVQPHYDDNDISAGGTLAALVENGADLFYVTATNDLVGFIDQSLSDEEMKAQLRSEQETAGAAIGVSKQFWLGYPDAGAFEYLDLRRDIIKHIRMIRPDFIVTCDPWMPYEAHRDHTITGRATAEASILFNFTRLKTDPEIDKDFTPFELKGVAFYDSAYANKIVDIAKTREKKYKALEAFEAQFGKEGLVSLREGVELKEKKLAEEEPFTHGEAFKILLTAHLHGFPLAMHI